MPAEKYHRQIAAIDRDYVEVYRREGEQVFKMGPSYIGSQFQKRNNAAYKVLDAKRTVLHRKLGRGDVSKGDAKHQRWAEEKGPRFLTTRGLERKHPDDPFEIRTTVFKLDQPRKSRKTRRFRARR